MKLGRIAKTILGLMTLSWLIYERSVPVLAASPEFSRTQEEWAKLQDDILEYDEIEALIHEYNPVVKSNEYSYQQFLKKYGRTNEKVSAAYHRAADQMESSKSGDDSAGAIAADLQAEIQAEDLRKQADENLEDGKIRFLMNEQTEKELTAKAQSDMIAYYIRKLEREQSRKSVERLERNLAMTELEKNAGMKTELDVMAVKEELSSAIDGLEKSESAILETKESLMLALGRKHDAMMEISGIPDDIEEGMQKIDPGSDLEKALENHWGRKIELQKKENAKSALIKEEEERIIRDLEKQIASALSAAHRNLILAKEGYDQAKKSVEQNLEKERVAVYGVTAGIMTDYEYRDIQDQARESELNDQIMRIKLFEALERYRWIVNGLTTQG